MDFVALHMMERGDFRLYLVFRGSCRSSGLWCSSLVPERCGSYPCACACACTYLRTCTHRRRGRRRPRRGLKDGRDPCWWQSSL